MASAFSAAVLYQLSYEDPYIGSSPVCWWFAEIQILNEDLIVAVVIAHLSNLGKCHYLLPMYGYS